MMCAGGLAKRRRTESKQRPRTANGKRHRLYRSLSAFLRLILFYFYTQNKRRHRGVSGALPYRPWPGTISVPYLPQSMVLPARINFLRRLATTMRASPGFSEA